jgi:hypothetical protein
MDNLFKIIASSYFKNLTHPGGCTLCNLAPREIFQRPFFKVGGLSLNSFQIPAAHSKFGASIIVLVGA